MSVNNREIDSWGVFHEFEEDYKSIISERYEVINKLLKNWNDLLKDLNGDPTYYNWNDFRPLRLSREEDWSDWLAHLIATSKTGGFSRFLFKLDNISDFSEPKKVHRELSSNNYRADIIIEWKNNCYSHVEVKIGDDNFNKIYKTRQEMMKKLKAEETNWADFILLLPSQLSSWEEESKEKSKEEASNKIISLTWEDVAIALRQALLGKETIVWKVWSWSFLGAIEQKLIGFLRHKIETKPEQNLETKIKILSDGLKKGTSMSNEAKEKFIEEGFKHYKQASAVMVYFRELLESRLQSILENRNEWANFTKEEAKAKSTRYGQAYPLFNAKLKGKLKHKDEDIEILISIALNWYRSKLDYPFYSVWMENLVEAVKEKFKRFEEKFEEFEWGPNFKYVDCSKDPDNDTIDKRKELQYIPKPEDFNLERDFKILLDEFNRFLNVL